MEFKYWAFISYSHRDKKWADWLHRELETYRVPKRLIGRQTRIGAVPKRVFPIFRDREELPVSADLGGNICQALEQSRTLIVICSPAAAQSRWVNEEIRNFKALRRADAVECLIVAGEPNASDKAGGADRECFPPALRFQVDAAGQLTEVRSEPIAADTRPGMDGRANAKLKLLAGLLGVGFDELKQRERVRRRKRVVGLIAGVILLGAAAFGLRQFEIEQGKRRLEEQRRATEAAQAEERGRQALLGGDASVAATNLQHAMSLRLDAGADLMLGIALRRERGMVGVLDHPEEKVFNAVVSPDGGHLLVAGDTEKVASIWDLMTKKLLREIRNFQSGIGPLDAPQFNARGDKLLLVHDNRAFVQDVATGGEIALGTERPTGCAFLGDGGTVLALFEFHDAPGKPPQVSVFDSATGRELRHFELGPGISGGLQADASGATALAGWFDPPDPNGQGINKFVGPGRLKWFAVASGTIFADLPRDSNAAQMELSPDGERLLYLRTDHVFEARSKTGVLWTVPVPRDMAPQGHWSGGGRYAVLTSFGKTIIFDGTNGKALWSDNFDNAATDAGDSVLAYSDREGTVHIRDLATGRILKVYPDRIGWPDPSNYPEDRVALLTRDGQRLFLAGSGNEVKIWNWREAVSDPVVLGQPRGPGKAEEALFSPDDLQVAIRFANKTAAVWDAQTGEQRALIDSGVWTMAWSGNELLTGAQKSSGSNGATLWEAATGKMLGGLDDSGPGPEERIRVASGAGRFVTVNFALGTGCLWDAAARQKIAEFSAGGRVTEITGGMVEPPRLRAAAGGNAFIVAGFDDVARVYSMRDAKPIATLAQPQLATAELCADGSVALTSDLTGHAAVWDVAKQAKTATPDAGTASINEIHLSADGRFVAAGCSDDCVRLWDGATGQFRRTFTEEKPAGEGIDSLGAPFDPLGQNKRGFLSVQFDPCGEWVAGINNNGDLCVWELSGGRQLVRWKVTPQSADAILTASPDGRYLAVAGLDGAVRVFDLTPASGAP